MGALGNALSAPLRVPAPIRILELVAVGAAGLVAVVAGGGIAHLPPSVADPIWWRPLLLVTGIVSAAVMFYGLICLAFWFATETVHAGKLVLAHLPSHPMQADAPPAPQTPEEVMAFSRQPTASAKVPIHYVGDGTRYLNGVPADPQITLYVSRKGAEVYVAGGLYAIGAAPNSN